MAEEKNAHPNFNQLIKTWVENQTQKTKVKVFDVELDTLEVTVASPKYQQTSRLEEGHKKTRMVPKVIENQDHAPKTVSGDIEEKVSHTKEHTLTKGLELGFELGAEFVVAFKFSATGSITQEKKSSQTQEETLREHYEFELPGKHGVEVQLEIAEIPKVDQFERDVNIKGHFTVHAKEKLVYDAARHTLRKPQSAEKGKKALKIPATAIDAILKQQPDVVCHLRGEGVVITLHGETRESVFRHKLTYGEAKWLPGYISSHKADSTSKMLETMSTPEKLTSSSHLIPVETVGFRGNLKTDAKDVETIGLTVYEQFDTVLPHIGLIKTVGVDKDNAEITGPHLQTLSTKGAILGASPLDKARAEIAREEAERKFSSAPAPQTQNQSNQNNPKT